MFPLLEIGNRHSDRKETVDDISASSPFIYLQMQGICVEIHEHTGADVIHNTLLAPREANRTAEPGDRKSERNSQVSEKSYLSHPVKTKKTRKLMKHL